MHTKCGLFSPFQRLTPRFFPGTYPRMPNKMGPSLLASRGKGKKISNLSFFRSMFPLRLLIIMPRTQTKLAGSILCKPAGTCLYYFIFSLKI